MLRKKPNDKLSEVRKKNFRVICRAMMRYELFVRATKRGQKSFVLNIDIVTTDTLHDMWDFLENEHIYYKKYSAIYPYDWAIDYVYGIEKDYRLVKVGKVGCYLYSNSSSQAIHSDDLGNFKNTKEYKGLLTKTDRDFPQENRQFDVLVSNPPYSVSAFKNNASKFYGKNDFELYNSLTDNSSEIEASSPKGKSWFVSA